MSLNMGGGKKGTAWNWCLFISPDLIQKLATSAIHTSKWGTTWHPNVVQVPPWGVISRWLRVDTNLQGLKMLTLVHQSAWWIVEIRYIWHLASCPSYYESSGPERPLWVSFTLEKHHCQNLLSFVYIRFRGLFQYKRSRATASHIINETTITCISGGIPKINAKSKKRPERWRDITSYYTSE